MLYGHGDDFYNAKNEVKINFSSNVWHGANLDKLKEHLIEHFDKLTRYPEPDAATLKRLLARRYEIKEEEYRSDEWFDHRFLFVSASLARCEIHDRYSFFL